MMTDADKLEYLTVESVQWATGYKRPRMSIEERRAKHRLTQRNFMLRERDRREELRASVRRLRLQLMFIEAMREAAQLSEENITMLWQQHPPTVAAEATATQWDVWTSSAQDYVI